ncbi:MAG TPA: glycosyltransferase [Phycisphaerales bacterium]|nr:glycosyltransferase [Phycisphaerales bacterium]
MTGPEPLCLYGVPVTPFDSYDRAVQYVAERIEAGKKTFCVAINPEKICLTFDQPALKDLLNSADMHICDGIGIVYAARLLLGRRIRRCTGVQLCLDLLRAAAQNGWAVFMLGASSESNEQACRKAEVMFPGLRIVGRRDGYFDSDDAVVQQINDSGADLVFVAMGSPRQEQWIAANTRRVDALYLMGVGGTFDVLSGKAKWAPTCFRRTGTEFLYRFAVDPKRWRRELLRLRFAFTVLKTRLAGSGRS